MSLINWNNIGLFISSDEDEKLFYRFPDSDQIKFINAGQNIGEVVEYLPEYVVVKGDKGGNYFLKNKPSLVYTKEPVSNFDLFGWIGSGTATIITNTKNKAFKNAGFVSDGFRKSINDLSKDIKGSLKIGLAVSVPLLVGTAIIFILMKR